MVPNRDEVDSDRARAEKLWQRLRAAGDRKAWKALVEEQPELWSWALCERLCHESFAVAEDDPGRAGDLVEVALDLAAKVPGEEAWRCRLQEYAWAHIANVSRVRGDLQGAEEAFRRAGELFLAGAVGLPGPLERGRIYGLEAALLRDQGRPLEALQKIDRAVDWVKDDSRAALFLLKGLLHRQLGQSEPAVKALAQAAKLAPKKSDGRLLVRATIELGSALCDAGRYAEAEPLPGKVLGKAAAFGTETARLLCLEGRIALGLDRRADAEAAFEKARGHREAGADLVLLALEVAVLQARQGRTVDLRDLAAHLSELLDSPALSRETIATLKLFCRLAGQDKLTAERAESFARQLSRAPVGRRPV